MAVEVLFVTGRQRRMPSANRAEEREGFIRISSDATEVVRYDAAEVVRVTVTDADGIITKVIEGRGNRGSGVL